MLAALLAAVVFALPVMPAQAKLPLGSVPPDVLGKSLDNDAITVSQFRGKVVVVTFWASWCGPCRRELPALDALKQAAGDRAEIVAVNVKDPTPNYHAITRQLKGTKLIFTHDTNGSISDGYQVDAYPNLFVIDQAGRVARIHVGYGEGALEKIVAEINELLLKPAVAKE
jgi:thiol-disulfide isomerase/thioredoxin